MRLLPDFKSLNANRCYGVAGNTCFFTIWNRHFKCVIYYAFHQMGALSHLSSSRCVYPLEGGFFQIFLNQRFFFIEIESMWPRALDRKGGPCRPTRHVCMSGSLLSTLRRVWSPSYVRSTFHVRNFGIALLLGRFIFWRQLKIVIPLSTGLRNGRYTFCNIFKIFGCIITLLKKLQIFIEKIQWNLFGLLLNLC